MSPTNRRSEYARMTREAILDAARSFFTEQGYYATKVEQIAEAARVAPATVYAVGGGKSGLLRTLIETSVNSTENGRLLAEIQAATDPGHLIRLVVAGTSARFGQWSTLMRQVVAAAPQEPAVREAMEIAHDSLRNGLRLTADRLATLGALRDGLDAADAADILWLYLCNAAYFVRSDDLGWPLDRSESWLNVALPRELLC
ncbi:TetR/AcrR family transcriptional regulator [Actinoplanes couchii]|uniref:TetR family transcriptional regulator n=1 Tax=Actinoplanes couchii TaxID=403638 RepID=A0ABQ3XQR4_9ACTN|nr:TetR/AcrR family transcriptional regulator [Actinoplanes couchii]MDR6318822.1 AcrR family transcriptional regulator [Actinoplanes couchii]GID60853.1 TetR family transcriptional regulator [Actinoplanes couchii]